MKKRSRVLTITGSATTPSSTFDGVNDKPECRTPNSALTLPHRTAPQTNPAAAKSILVDVGLWTARGQDDGDEGDALVERAVGTRDGANSSVGEEEEEEAGEGAGVLPWSAEALQAAAALGKERARRSVNYGKREPQGNVGAPAPFGR